VKNIELTSFESLLTGHS